MHFLEDCAIPSRGENILAAIIRMAQQLNIPTVAEGVEKQEQVDFLRKAGCGSAQGYFFARPMPVKEYESMIVCKKR